MNAKKLKKLRKEIYGDMAKTVTYARHENGMHLCTELRAEYLRRKRESR